MSTPQEYMWPQSAPGGSLAGGVPHAHPSLLGTLAMSKQTKRFHFPTQPPAWRFWLLTQHFSLLATIGYKLPKEMLSGIRSVPAVSLLYNSDDKLREQPVGFICFICRYLQAAATHSHEV